MAQESDKLTVSHFSAIFLNYTLKAV